MGKRGTIIAWMGFVLSCFTGLPVSSQAFHVGLPSESGENITLNCDRSLYGVSEKLYYSAFCLKSHAISDLEWSSVLYVELIEWNGTKLAQSKSPIIDGHADGTLQIPENIQSGNYYLRAYTKWMRNYSPYLYSYLMVKVVNPYSILIGKGPAAGERLDMAASVTAAESSDVVVIAGVKETYGKRQLVELDIQLPDGIAAGSYCLSVAKSGLHNKQPGSFRFIPGDQSQSAAEIEFLPEIEGLSIAGKIIYKDTGEPVPQKKINLSSYSGSFYSSSVTSDNEGGFLFVLPAYEGNHEFHVAQESDSSDVFRILITNEFCHQPVHLPYLPFQLDQQEEIRAKEIILNAQLGSKYVVQDSTKRNDSDIHKAFYGLPGTVTYEKDFIELNNLEEFFYEVVHNVTVGTIKRKPYLMVNGSTSLLAYPPLILMDNIPVSNIENLLETGCRRIDRVEVVDKGYVLGDFKYNGIISIFSEKRDMAGIELTGDSQFFNFQLYSASDYTFPDYSVSGNHSTVADRRNLLYWDPGIQLSDNDTVRVSFYTSDAPGQYMVRIQSIQPEGNTVLYGTSSFMVE